MTLKERWSRRTGSTKSGDQRQESTDLISEKTLWSRLQRSDRARQQFVESHLYKNLSFQIRGLRDREKWTQGELGQRVQMTQNSISKLENPFKARPTLTTLKRLAAVFDVALIVRFVPFSQLVKWVTGTEYVDSGLSPAYMSVPSFDSESSVGPLWDEQTVPRVRLVSRRERRARTRHRRRANRIGQAPNSEKRILRVSTETGQMNLFWTPKISAHTIMPGIDKQSDNIGEAESLNALLSNGGIPDGRHPTSTAA
jgi:transcriptional regulator with XRE-family HTH domain